MFEKKARRASDKAGMPPGALILVGDRSENTRISIIDFDQHNAEERDDVTIDEVFSSKETRRLAWINVTGLQDVSLIEQIGRGYDIHPLVLEDILHVGQRPKIEIFEDYVFLVFKMVQIEEETGELDIEQVSLILGANYIITFQEKRGDVFDPVRQRIMHGKGRIRTAGSDYLTYALIDVVVDYYFHVMDYYEELSEDLEDRVLGDTDDDIANRLHNMRRDIIQLRKVIGPLREVVASLSRIEGELIAKESHPYIRDLYDHIIRVNESFDSMREILAGLREMYLSSISNRMNQVMKVLTIIATIFIPMTFLAGVYGMNFEYMPELKIWWAYPAIWAVFLSISGVMVLFFKRKKWL